LEYGINIIKFSQVCVLGQKNPVLPLHGHSLDLEGSDAVCMWHQTDIGRSID